MYRLEFVSNQDYTDHEFHKWKETIVLACMQLPTKQDLERKLKDIGEALKYRPKDSDIDTVSGHWSLYSPITKTYLKMYFYTQSGCK